MLSIFSFASIVGVDAPLELDLDVGAALVGVGGHLLDVADGGEDLLDRPRDLGLHLLRCGARVRHGDGHERRVEGRKELQRQEPGRDRPDHDDAEEHHQGGDGSAQRPLGELHGLRSRRS
jgi:hypothetical protein